MKITIALAALGVLVFAVVFAVNMHISQRCDVERCTKVAGGL